MKNDIYTVNLPDIGEGVVEGEVIDWLKQVGDAVNQDEPVVVVMTDKATVELSAPYPGVIVRQYFKKGEISLRDQPLYDIELASGVAATHTTKRSHQIPAANKECSQALPTQVSMATPPRHGKVLAAPKVRAMAQKLGIDIEKVHGTGPEGRVTLEDLQSPQMNTPIQMNHHLEGDEVHQLQGIRGVMARKMEKHHIPQFSYFEQVDVTRLIQLRQNMKNKAAEENISLSYMPFFIRALSLIMREYPEINSSLDMQNHSLVIHQQHNIGIAVASPQGLIVPVLKGVQNMNLQEVVRAFDVLKAKVVAGKLSSNDMKEGTITVSNFGVLGDGLWATPMVSGTEVAILAIARIRKLPVVRENEIVIRDILALSWSFDHRVIDGELAAKISHKYSALLQNPASLL